MPRLMAYRLMARWRIEEAACTRLLIDRKSSHFRAAGGEIASCHHARHQSFSNGDELLSPAPPLSSNVGVKCKILACSMMIYGAPARPTFISPIDAGSQSHHGVKPLSHFVGPIYAITSRYILLKENLIPSHSIIRMRGTALSLKL